MNAKSLAWGILGTGKIAATFASELPHSRMGRLVAVGSRNLESARRFAAQYPETLTYGSYEELLAASEVEAVYIATPHDSHARLSLLAAEAGKHILCEKPAALNYRDALSAIKSAQKYEVLYMEAFMYRCHPRTVRIAELVATGIIGQVQLIEAAFCYHTVPAVEGRLFEPKFGGGGIMDVGCYTTSVARMVAGAALGQSVAEPDKVLGAALRTPVGVDTVASALLQFPRGILAQLTCGITVSQQNDLKVYGDEGTLFVPEFWNPPGPIQRLDLDGTLLETIESDPFPYKYAMEADSFAASLGAPEQCPVTHEDTLGNMKTLDRWREAAGINFPSDVGDEPQRKAARREERDET